MIHVFYKNKPDSLYLYGVEKWHWVTFERKKNEAQYQKNGIVRYLDMCMHVNMYASYVTQQYCHLLLEIQTSHMFRLCVFFSQYNSGLLLLVRLTKERRVLLRGRVALRGSGNGTGL